MKRIFLFLMIINVLFLQKTEAQNKGDNVAALAGGLMALGAGIAAVEQMKEQAELTATQYILSNNPELTSFSLKTLSFDGKKLKDISRTSVIIYKIQEFSPQNHPKLDGKKQVLFGFTNQGWINQYGINFNKVIWFLVDETEWMDMMVAYVSVSSEEKNQGTLQTILREGRVVNKGVKLDSKLKIPFFKLLGDMYLVTDYSEDMKLVYNERTLGIFLKETSNLVQIGRGDIINIHEFFFDED